MLPELSKMISTLGRAVEPLNWLRKISVSSACAVPSTETAISAVSHLVICMMSFPDFYCWGLGVQRMTPSDVCERAALPVWAAVIR